MAIRSASDLIYTAIARLPLLLVVAAVVWVLYSGLLALETYSFGSEYLIRNDQSANELPGLPGPNQQDVLAAIESGDLAQMEAVLDEVAATTPQVDDQRQVGTQTLATH